MAWNNSADRFSSRSSSCNPSEPIPLSISNDPEFNKVS